MSTEKDPPEQRGSTGVTRPYAAKATQIARDLARVIDALQALAVEIEDGRDVNVLHVAELLVDAKHHLSRTIQLLGMT